MKKAFAIVTALILISAIVIIKNGVGKGQQGGGRDNRSKSAAPSGAYAFCSEPLCLVWRFSSGGGLAYITVNTITRERNIVEVGSWSLGTGATINYELTQTGRGDMRFESDGNIIYWNGKKFSRRNL